MKLGLLAIFQGSLNYVPLNKSNLDLLVNILKYHQIDKNEKVTRLSWVTDIEITISISSCQQAVRCGKSKMKRSIP